MKRVIILLAMLIPSALLAQSADTVSLTPLTPATPIEHHVDSVLMVVGDGETQLTIKESISQNGVVFGVANYSFELTLAPKKKTRKAQPKLDIFDDMRFGLSGLYNTDYSGYSAADNGFLDMRLDKSTVFGFSFVKLELPITRNGRNWFTMGFSSMWANYNFSEKLTVTYQNGVMTPIAIDPSYKKSKLRVSTLSVPFTYRYVSYTKFSVEVYGSVDFGMGAKTKYKRPKVKSDKMWMTNPVGASVGFVTSYRDIGFFVNAQLTPMFKDGAGPDTRAITFGIQL